MKYICIVKKVLLAGLMATAMVALFWVSAPLVWYPKFHKIDIASLTEEVDTLFSACPTDASVETINVALDAQTTPYLLSLNSVDTESNQLSVSCTSGVRLKLWDDWWASSAGLYIVRDGYNLPTSIAPFATALTARVHSWHNPG